MAAPFNHAEMQKLKGFVEFVSANPTILNLPQLDFVKQFVEKLGGKVPAGEFKIPDGAKCPFGGDAHPAPDASSNYADEADDVIVVESDSESESDLELDMEGVIDPDEVGDQLMGDSEKQPTEEEIEQASELRSEAARAYSEQEYQKAIECYTKAIELNPGNALFHAKRGQAYLKLQKPNACIHDCNKALEINCDSAAAYKFRGRAHRLLGSWELAAKDLRQACKLDFDEEADEWLREVTPNALKIEKHRIKQQRRETERKAKAARKAAHKARNAANAQENAGAGFGGFPSFPGGGGMPFAGMPAGVNMGELLTKMKDPEVAAAVQDILQNPNNVGKYASNPKILHLLKDFFLGGNIPPEMAGETGNGSADTPSTKTEEPKTETKESAKKKADFADDGLD